MSECFILAHFLLVLFRSQGENTDHNVLEQHCLQALVCGHLLQQLTCCGCGGIIKVKLGSYSIG